MERGDALSEGLAHKVVVFGIREVLQDLEILIVRDAIQRSDGNKSRAADRLKLSRAALGMKIRKWKEMGLWRS